MSTRKDRDNLARFGITASKVFGVRAGKPLIPEPSVEGSAPGPAAPAVAPAAAPEGGRSWPVSPSLSMANSQMWRSASGAATSSPPPRGTPAGNSLGCLTSFVDEPARVAPAQIDRWCRDFDKWSICDTLCFNLFDRTPYAWAKVAQWSDQRDDFVKRAAFALL